MFGYVKIHKDELKIKEYNTYRAYYCGLCFAIKKHFGNIPRLTQSNDAAFLALLLSSLNDNALNIQHKRCILNPFKKRPVVLDDDILEYAAAVNIILLYFKIKDDLADGFSAKSFLSLPFILPSARKAKKLYKKVFDIAFVKLKNLSELESSLSGDIDRVSHQFAELLAELFSAFPIQDEKEQKILYRIGYSLGRFIYIADAIDDLEEDIQKKRYNPLIYNDTFSIDELKNSLMFTLSDLSLSYELLDIKKNKSILDNIIYLGLYNSFENIFNKKTMKTAERQAKTNE